MEKPQLEKVATSTVTEVDTDPESESPDTKSGDNIKAAEAVVAAQPDIPAVRRMKTMHRRRRRKQKPLPLDRAYATFHRVPRAVKCLLIIILSGIPFMIFMLVARYALQGQPIGPAELHATYFKLAKWLIICWGSLLIVFGLAIVLASFSSWCCRLSRSSAKYAPLATTLCFRITLLVWSGIAYQANCYIWHTDAPDPKIKDDWPRTLKQVFVFLAVSFAILLVQGIVLQLIAIRYVEGFVGPRSVRATNELETIQALNNLVKPHIEADNPSFMVKMLKRAFWPVEDTLYEKIIRGRASEEDFREYAARLWNAITLDLSKEALTVVDITDRLQKMGRDPEPGEDLFTQLDESCDGNVTRDELEKLVVTTGSQLSKRAESMRGIKSLLHKLEVLLTCLVFGVIVFVYSNFFNQDWVKDSKALWTGVTGLGFALNGTIAEFVNACVFVFAKHAYDVGDLVEAKSKKLIVKDIHLTHTNFQEVREDEKADATGMVVQISHASLATEVITNWTRSNDLKVAAKEEKQDDVESKVEKV